MKGAKLLPCPFCGEPNTSTVAGDVDCYFVRCSDCLAEGPPEESLPDAARAWNDRAIGAPDRRILAAAASDPSRFAGPQGHRDFGEWVADAIRIQLTSR